MKTYDAVYRQASETTVKRRSTSFPQQPQLSGLVRGLAAYFSWAEKQFANSGPGLLTALQVSLGFSLRQIARDLRTDHSTISRAARRDGEFAAALARAKEERSERLQLGFRGWRNALRVLQRHGKGW